MKIKYTFRGGPLHGENWTMDFEGADKVVGLVKATSDIAYWRLVENRSLNLVYELFEKLPGKFIFRYNDE